MQQLVYISVIDDAVFLNRGWHNDTSFADQLLDWCVLRFGTTSQGAWNYKQYNIGGRGVYELQFLNANYKLLFDLQFSEAVTIYHSAEQFYEANKFIAPGVVV